ncbi:HAD-like protein [Phlegmacium glaucopus]|nr:HAD-like protein [Phlegmacium glaucopus]
MLRIRLITFDALHTIITPRHPIHVQYSQVFAPFLGVLPPESIKNSFTKALKQVQAEHPSYDKGAKQWWSDVIRRTAIGAGASRHALDKNLSDIVETLMVRFSSKEGYKAFDDAISTIRDLHDQQGIRTAIVSNGDNRIRKVLKDLSFPDSLQPVVLSEEEGIEKPSGRIFMKALELVNGDLRTESTIRPEECLHIGDELICDYNGAVAAGFNALLLRREGPDGHHEHKEMDEDISRVSVIHNLSDVISWLLKKP